MFCHSLKCFLSNVSSNLGFRIQKNVSSFPKSFEYYITSEHLCHNYRPFYFYLSFITIVIPIKDEMRITGLPDVLEAGTVAELTCSIDRIKPPSPIFYWTINGLRVNGTLRTVSRNDGSALKQENVITYR